MNFFTIDTFAIFSLHNILDSSLVEKRVQQDLLDSEYGYVVLSKSN